MTDKHFKINNYLPLFILLCLSGNPIFTSQDYSKSLLVAYTFLFSFYTLVMIESESKGNVISKFILVLSFITIIVIAQKFILGFVSYPGVFAIILKIFLGLITLLYYKNKNISIFHIYIKIMVFLVIISIPLLILNQFEYFGLSLARSPYYKSLIIYTSHTYTPYAQMPFGILRNFGMFWEPGAFAGYLNLALIFIVLENKNFIMHKYKKEAYWIIVGIISTLSTAGYVVLSIMILFYFVKNFKWGKIILVPALVLILYYFYLNVPILGEKINAQFYEASNYQPGDFTSSRFGSLLWDSQYIRAQPIWGNGLNIKTRYRFDTDIIDANVGNGNGMSNFIATWGIPLFLFWLYCFYKLSLNISESKKVSLILLFIIILILQGEQFLNFPLFLVFFVLSDSNNT